MTTDDRQVIADLEERRHRAMVDSDTDALSEMFDDELTYTHSNATSDSKASYLQRIRDGNLDYGSLDHENCRILVVGGCAFVWGTMTGDVMIDGAPRQLNSATLVVWVRRHVGWRLLAFQPTRIPVS